MPSIKLFRKRLLSPTERASLVMQGMITILFGLIAIFWPNMTALTLLYIFATFLLLDGIVGLILGFMRFSKSTSGVLMLGLGILQLGVGVYMFYSPSMSYSALIMMLGIVLFIRGIFAAAHTFVHKGTRLARE